MLKYYYYLFYKFYKFVKWTPSIFPSDFGAIVLINSFEIGILVSIFNFKDIISNSRSTDKVFLIEVAIPTVVIISIHAVIFSSDNILWKRYLNEFENWPKQKKMKGTWIVIALLVLVITIIITSFNLYSNLPHGNL